MTNNKSQSDEANEVADAAATFPKAYRPFLPVLERLSVAMQRILVGHFERLEQYQGVFDPLKARQQGEFIGLEGITNKGDMSHLLQSELLLQQEAPLEFLRRISESELLFHEKAYEDPGQKSVYRLMISTGPGLLGHGRLVALAVVFFLARTAARRGALFHWCYLPREEGVVWFEEVSVNTVKRFLKAGSYRDMSADEVLAARDTWTELSEGRADDKLSEVIDWTLSSPLNPSNETSRLSSRRLTVSMQPQLDDDVRKVFPVIDHETGVLNC